MEARRDDARGPNVKRPPLNALSEAWETLIGSYRPKQGGVLDRRQLEDLFRALHADSGGLAEAGQLDRSYALLSGLFVDHPLVWVLPEEDELPRAPRPRLVAPGAIARALPARRFAPLTSSFGERAVGPVSASFAPLLFGRYLLGEGFISLGELTEAISWQRQQRPAVGQIAIDWRILTSEQVDGLLHEKPRTQLFCDFAVARGLMSSFERLAVLAKQRRLQRPIGQYFVERGILTQEQVDALARRVAR